MKSAIIACTLVVLACLYSHASAKDRETNCNLVKGDLSLHYGICGRITCNPDGSTSAVGCGQYQCRDGEKPISYKETDNSKPYPECCGGPVCPK